MGGVPPNSENVTRGAFALVIPAHHICIQRVMCGDVMMWCQNMGLCRVSTAATWRYHNPWPYSNPQKWQASAPGTAEGQVSTVKTEGSGWSNATALSGQKRARSYLYGA